MLERNAACRRLETATSGGGREMVRVEALDGAAFSTAWGRAAHFALAAETTEKCFEWPPDVDARDVEAGDADPPRVPAAALDAACALARVAAADTVVDATGGDGRVAAWAVARYGASRAVALVDDAGAAAAARAGIDAGGLADRVAVVDRGDAAAAAALEDATLLAVHVGDGSRAWEPLVWNHLRKRGTTARVLCFGARPDGYVAKACRRLDQPYAALDPYDAYLLTRDSRPRRRPNHSDAGESAARAPVPAPRVRLATAAPPTARPSLVGFQPSGDTGALRAVAPPPRK